MSLDYQTVLRKRHLVLVASFWKVLSSISRIDYAKTKKIKLHEKVFIKHLIITHIKAGFIRFSLWWLKKLGIYNHNISEK